MLTPGAEYFTADSDAHAVSIAHGTAVPAERARLDGNTPASRSPSSSRC